MQEVVDGLALAQELGVRRDRDVLARRAGLGQHPLHEPRRADRHRRLVDDDGLRREHRRDLPGDAPRRSERSAAPSTPCGVCTQRNTISAPRAAAAAPDDERQPLRREALRDERGQAVLEDRHLALAQPGDPLGVDVGAHDLVTEMGEAGRGGEPDVAGPDDRDRSSRLRPRRRHPSGRPVPRDVMLEAAER